MTRIFITLAFVTSLIFAGCDNSVCYTMLETVDSLTEKDFLDSATNVLKRVEETQRIKDGKEKAYYGMLKYQLQFRTQYGKGKYSVSDSLVDYSISYYSEHPDARKLALCYYLKGRTSAAKEAMKYLKKAEYAVQNANDESLKMRIFCNIASINVHNEDYKTALKYEKKAIEHGMKANDNVLLASCFRDMSAIYGNLNMIDSCVFYAEKSLDYIKNTSNEQDETGEANPDTGEHYIKNTSNEQKAYIYLNVAAALMNTDTVKAGGYARKSIEAMPTNNAYQILAKLARERNDYHQSEKYLYEALKYSKSVDWEAFIVHELAETKELMGNYKEARMLSKRVIALRDSFERIRARDSIREIQMVSDLKHVTQEEIQEKDSQIVLIVGGLTLLVLAVIAVYGWKRRSHKASMGNIKKQLGEYEHEIRKKEEENRKIEEEKKKIEEENREKDREKKVYDKKMHRLIEKMKQKAIERQQEENERYRDGYTLYNKVKETDCPIAWDKNSMQNLMTYYLTVVPDFKTRMECAYSKLTDYQYVILIMKDMNLSSKQIAYMLGVTDSAVRSQLSRIKKQAIGETEEP